ncbi:MAG: hypothetical protein JXB38_09695 [Anaerolineales bacterium]|nr:hypothetical protein [Anaerolineales bacterium]
MWKRIIAYSLGILFVVLVSGCNPTEPEATRIPTNTPAPITPTTIPETLLNITINAVHVDQHGQLIASGQSTLPDEACIQTTLSLDGQPVNWWPGDACAALQSGLWMVSFSPPNSLNTGGQYQLQAHVRDNPRIVSKPFYFDLAGPPTAIPAEPTPALAACVVQATRTPPPAAPTRIPSEGIDEVRYVDPHVELCAAPNSVPVGQQVVVYAQTIDIGLPFFTLWIKEDIRGEFHKFVRVNDQRNVSPEASALLEFVDIDRESQYSNRIAFVFTARQAGTIEITVDATGEVHYGYPGPATWAGGGSDILRIEVIPAE